MLISNPPNLPTYSLVSDQPDHKLISWTLKWQQKHLIVKARKPQSHQAGLEFADEQRLQECLQKSSVKIIHIDPALGAANLQMWATACKHAQKAIFVRAAKIQKLTYVSSSRWRLKRACDFFMAIALLLILSPVILGLIAWQWIKSPQSPIFSRQWRIGARGQLFELLKFNTLTTAGTGDRVQNLPQLFNVLRGEMSLVGARPWALTEVNYLAPKQLNTLPGITGLPEIETPLAVSSVSGVQLTYINNWSLAKDLKILRQTLPKFFSSSIN
ncbi:heterocyst development glycosyltransferase HepC [Synechocystis sp. PCC 7509]|uniref:heterocyst development glycosyltransferase HepC n=1 Tax=Synechocystis sp. PCC 7509 TaxID=927677 RepID=UPI0002ABF069|nr:heterocyst development glycosyltransferase HepC [Synechocystis sp. PCC 7509]